MKTSDASRARRHNGSKATDRRGVWQRGSRRLLTGTALAPDGAGHLSNGVLVETHLLARVLGIRLLRIDGVVTLAPARLAASSVDPRAVPMTSTMELGHGLERAADLLRDCERYNANGSTRTSRRSGPR